MRTNGGRFPVSGKSSFSFKHDRLPRLDRLQPVAEARPEPDAGVAELVGELAERDQLVERVVVAREADRQVSRVVASGKVATLRPPAPPTVTGWSGGIELDRLHRRSGRVQRLAVRVDQLHEHLVRSPGSARAQRG